MAIIKCYYELNNLHFTYIQITELIMYEYMSTRVIANYRNLTFSFICRSKCYPMWLLIYITFTTLQIYFFKLTLLLIRMIISCLGFIFKYLHFF